MGSKKKNKQHRQMRRINSANQFKKSKTPHDGRKYGKFANVANSMNRAVLQPVAPVTAPSTTPPAVPTTASTHVPSPALAGSSAALPVARHRKRLLRLISRNKTCVIMGETGSGKTTQVPVFLLKSGLARRIAVTQPRRVAAISVAEHVAKLCGTPPGGLVGHHVRFSNLTSADTQITYLTDGMLLREATDDGDLSRYDCVILDEAHERTLSTDLLLGILKRAVEKRSDLKVVLMSATMDADHFSRFFTNAPVTFVDGRQFPIQEFFAETPEDDYVDAAVTTASQLNISLPGHEHFLIFLTGQEEIESVVRRLRRLDPPVTALPMYAALPYEKLLAVYKAAPSGIRKIIVATNVAETSLTLPGVSVVIDCGRAKTKAYSAVTGLERLTVEWISQCQSWQRGGRAGRTSPGRVYRLFTESRFSTLQLTPVPEIMRSSLASAVLQLLRIGVRDPLTFPLMDRPSPEAIIAAQKLLTQLGALTSEGSLSPLGKQLASLPLEPRLSRSLCEAASLGCLKDALAVVSLLSVDSIFRATQGKERPFLKFYSSEGDLSTLLNIYRAFSAQRKGSSRKRWCVESGVDLRQLIRATEVNGQLTEDCERLDWSVSSSPARLGEAFSAGLASNCAQLQPDGTYKTLNGHTVAIHPASSLFGHKPPLVLFAELLQSNRTYMSNLITVRPEWLLEHLPEQLRRKLDIPE